jgi:hypothetical protein
MYPYYGNVLESVTPEYIAFEKHLDDLGMICTLEEWFITEAWAMRFKTHLQKRQALRLLMPPKPHPSPTAYPISDAPLLHTTRVRRVGSGGVWS